MVPFHHSSSPCEKSQAIKGVLDPSKEVSFWSAPSEHQKPESSALQENPKVLDWTDSFWYLNFGKELHFLNIKQDNLEVSKIGFGQQAASLHPLLRASHHGPAFI